MPNSFLEGQRPNQFRVWTNWTAAALLLIMLFEIALSTRQVSASWDEGDHIFSGYMNWKHGEYSFNPEHPPLVKLIAALPLLPLDLKIAPREGRYFKSEAYYGGRELLFRNDPKYGGLYTADSLLFRAHMAVSIFALTLALLLFLAGREMFGPSAGLVAMTLFVFDPTILTNAPFVTTDSGATCLFFASVFVFYRYIKQPSWQRIVLCGIVFGVALVTKHSTVLLAPMIILLAIGEVFGRALASRRKKSLNSESSNSGQFALNLAASMLAMAAIAITVLWSVYSFHYAMHPVGEDLPAFEPRALGLSPVIAHLILFCAYHHLLPESYLYGLVDVQRVGNFMPSYIFGKLYAHGKWFYFPVGLALKWSIGVLGLLALTLYALTRRLIPKPRELFFLALPAAFYLAVAMAGPLNIGVRHVLPVFPFAFLLAGAGAWALLREKRIWIYSISALLLWHITDSVRMFPNYMPYANILWGGPSKTHLYLSDSATDWGQELKFTKQYLDAHNLNNCWFAYFPAPFLLPSDYGVPCKLLPTADTEGELNINVPPVIHGPVLVAYADLNGFEFGSKILNPYQSFFERQPDDVIANGIAVYNGDFAVPALASFQPAFEGQQLLGANKTSAALEKAQDALNLDVNNLNAQIAAGDALHALNQDAEARRHYAMALELINQMEPSAREQWKPTLIKKLSNLIP